MNQIIIGNVISLIGCIMFFISCRLKKQKHICALQSIECLVTGTATLVLGGIVGALTTYIASIRNILGIWKMNGKLCTIMCLIAISILTIWNYNSLWDLLPLLATITYTIALSFKSAKITKIGVIPNSSIWFVYCLHIGSYVNCIFNIINIVFAIKDIRNRNYLD